jgi:5-methylcytosine-specific restriction enzyme A
MAPMRPKKPCAHPMCPALVDSGQRFCDAHRKAESKAYEQRTNRGSSSARGYGGAWRKLRELILSQEPLCRECKRNGRVTAATNVDHIIAKAHGGTDDPSNLQPLCEHCKRSKDAREHLNRPQ